MAMEGGLRSLINAVRPLCRPSPVPSFTYAPPRRALHTPTLHSNLHQVPQRWWQPRTPSGRRTPGQAAILPQARWKSTDTQPPPEPVMSGLRRAGEEEPRSVRAPTADEHGEIPSYELTFTCKPCRARSVHRISKHGYHNGSVLVTCPSCKNRHVISDHLRIFDDSARSLEDILAKKGESFKAGVLDPDGDIELWDDGTRSARQKEGTSTPPSAA